MRLKERVEELERVMGNVRQWDTTHDIAEATMSNDISRMHRRLAALEAKVSPPQEFEGKPLAKMSKPELVKIVQTLLTK